MMQEANGSGGYRQVFFFMWSNGCLPRCTARKNSRTSAVEMVEYFDFGTDNKPEAGGVGSCIASEAWSPE